MNNVIMLPKSLDDSDRNLDNLVQHYKNVFPFKTVDWSNFVWNVTGFVQDTARKAQSKKRLYFTQDNGLPNRVKQALEDMLPFHSSSLSEIAKCHICAKQIEKVKTVGNLQIKIGVYRYLDNELHKRNLPASSLTSRIFSDALQKAVNKLELSTAYRIGTHLNEISKFIDKHGLADVKIKFKSSLKRSQVQTESDTKMDAESITERSEKLPTQAVLMAVAKLTNMDLQGADRLYHAITEILFATGLRFDEVISLSVDCLYEKEIEELNQLTGALETYKFWELKYFSKKSQCVFSKVIAKSMVSIIKPAIDFVIDYQIPVRKVIKDIENNSYYNFFDEISGECLASDKAVYSLFASSRSNAATRLRKLGVKVKKDEDDNNSFLAEELQAVTSDLAASSIRKLWLELKSKTTSTCLSEMLFITQHQREHQIKSSNSWDFRLIAHTPYSDFMTGRITNTAEIKSIFERKNLLIDDKAFIVTSHQFRHFLNTICQLHEGITELEIARYFGRNYQADNQAYDHTNKVKIVMDNAQQILAANSITEDQAVEAMVNFTLVDSEEALEAIQNLSTTLVTSIGLCKHDFADSPCGKHYACLRGCSSYTRTKGDQIEIKELNRIIEQEKKHLIHAKESVAKEYWGSNNWLLSHQDLHDGCVKALSIEDDNNIDVGDTVQIFPEGNDSCLALEEENNSGSKGLLS
ncbi:hypothetical protein [Aliiglaciecola litoralis]|uniref:Integrase n=1 Tax=Aliiglaciecola litoralis TaxID=582857 RepID=A0ABP3WWI3_9ALTE